jgi:hypothetical protein
MLPKYFLPTLLSATVGRSSVTWLGEPPPATLINTVWVPRTIAWVQPFPHDVEMSGIQYADFPLLCFRAQGQFMRISSYHSRGDNDTIIVATEPGIKVDFGRYQVDPTRLVVLSKTGYRTINFTPSVKDKERTDTLLFRGPYLVYQGVEYRPHTKFSGQNIPSFWAYNHAK